MKLTSLITALVLSSQISIAQDAKLILQQCYDQCQSVQNGYYEMTKYIKLISATDTSTSSFTCYFKKLKEDTLFQMAFHYKAYWKNEYTGNVMYTGNDFVTSSTRDSMATIMSTSMWAQEIKSHARNYKFYSPLITRKSIPLLHDADFINNRHVFKYIGEENLNGAGCYHIRVNDVPENDSTAAMKTLRVEYDYWIKKEDSVPIQYSIAFDMVMNKDTIHQYEKNVLNKYELNNLQDENILTLNSIPAFYRMKEYVPFKNPEPISKDSIAPAWELSSLTDEKISLKNLKGKLVLIDFFYKSCYPCRLAIPALQSLSEKYKSKGLQVIGIDPYDKKEELIHFLSKQGVTYSVLLNGKDAAKDYRVSGYPTMYLIDKTGKIIFVQVGYGKDTEHILDELIKKNL